ncbi:MAG: alcohol dehydrogenase catalytic domain-containing protein [Solirubrobacterales bacterium]|nr:alcohol dehydrogenase catalytic domain-containing protein [Solirubrobacterales bacterium]MBV9682846.1 alcohol dehydrogenase catalytic domain-containing protein [Solirubrobacterales bacterium]
MRAALLYGPQDLRVQEIPDPDPDDAEGIVVEVEAATTCGTDVKMWHHGHRVLPPYPCAFGHETAGTRADTGERVLVSDSVACGACPPCRAGRPQICRCPTWVLGGFAERIAAPEAALHGIPDGLPAAAAAMAEPLAAAVHAVDRGSDAQDAGILGGGPMGLMLAALLIGQGRSVTLADPHPERRAQAAQLGADAAARLARHELVFEAVGRPEAWRAAVAAAAPGAVVVLVGGCPSGSEVTLDPGPLHYDELELRGAFHHAPAEVDRALAALADGLLPREMLLGPTISLDELPAALASPSGGPAKKWVVDPRRTMR